MGVAALYTATVWSPFAFIGAARRLPRDQLRFSPPGDRNNHRVVVARSRLLGTYRVRTQHAGCVSSFRGLRLVPWRSVRRFIAAQEADVGGGVLIGYLLGLGVVQYAISAASGWIAWNVWKAIEAAAIQARLAGAVVAGVGLFLSMENAEGIVFEVMGWSS